MSATSTPNGRMSQTSTPASPAQDAGAPKVTVCVITYNQVRYIGACLQSLVEQQTDFPFEVLVGDDCSTDGTADVVADFARQHPGLVTLHRQPSNTGGSRNNNELHARARGEYVAHVDGDDLTLPGKLQAQVDVLDGDPECTAVWHRVDFFDDAGGFCSGTLANWSSFKDGIVTFADGIQLGFVGVFSSIMYRRSARTPTVDMGKLRLDLHWTWDLLGHGHGRVIEQVLGRYRVSSSGSLTQAGPQRVRRLALEHAREFLQRYPERRRDFLVWALSCAVIDARNRRSTTLDHARFALACATTLNPLAVLDNLRRLRATQAPWRQRREVRVPRSNSTLGGGGSAA